jgi:hypothetical protein
MLLALAQLIAESIRLLPLQDRLQVLLWIGCIAMTRRRRIELVAADQFGAAWRHVVVLYLSTSRPLHLNLVSDRQPSAGANQNIRLLTQYVPRARKTTSIGHRTIASEAEVSLFPEVVAVAVAVAVTAVAVVFF